MGKTERYLKRANLPGGSPPEPSLHQPREIQVRVACKGKTAAEVLTELGRGLTDAGAKGLDPLIVLEDLGLLQDSVMTLIKGLSRLLVGYPRTVTFWESSGFTEAFLSVMDGQSSKEQKQPPDSGR